MLSTKEYI